MCDVGLTEISLTNPKDLNTSPNCRKYALPEQRSHWLVPGEFSMQEIRHQAKNKQTKTLICVCF